MGTNCTHLVAELFLFCYEKDFMISLTRDNQADSIEAFNSISRYFDGLLNIANVHLELMVDRIYPAELQLNKANSSDTEAPFSDLNLYIYNYSVSTKLYYKRDDLDFDIVNFTIHDGFKKLLQQGISEHEFYGDLVYKGRQIVGKSYFSEQFRNSLIVIQ